MSRWLHHLLLILLLLAAVLVWGTGRHFSQHEELHRVPESRGEWQPVVRQLRDRLDKLEADYTGHLHRLARQIDPAEDINNRRLSQGIVGVARCSNLYADPYAVDGHADIDPVRCAAFARPMLVAKGGAFTSTILLPLNEIAARRRGWLDLRDQPPFYFEGGNKGQFVVLTIDPEAVVEAMLQDLQHDQRLTGVAQRVVVVAPDGRVAVTLSEGSIRGVGPDVVLPVPTRFGVWQVQVLDQRRLVTVVNQGIRTASNVAAVLLAVLGLVTWWYQRRAMRTAQQRVSFVNSVSHELRTPLTNMMLNLDLAADELPEHPRLEHVRQEAGRLGRLVENVLTFSRAEQGRLKLCPGRCDVAEVVAALAATFEPLFVRREIRFSTEVEVPAALKLDADALKQILSNLLSNVEKYAPQVQASLAAKVQEKDLCIVVADQGPGIPEREALHIFEPFVRLGDEVTEGVSGTGLGLSIARDLARRMGGDLAMIPVDQGACFRLVVPAIPFDD